ncbi:uncharacterized protein UBRO_20094 [Ustilago bromivora]|uniref:Uncharacterized protein n=1 Tax=Ustilago bromivora TaxID=307758 RepID=A0A1K0HGC7_9BASI|nr:uncharacterized protein UBRO_20094 [Ustilago bromivora]
MHLQSMLSKPYRRLHAACCLTPTSKKDGGHTQSHRRLMSTIASLEQHKVARHHLRSFNAEISSLHHVRCFGCTAYVILHGNTRTTWLRDNPVVSKHLRPQALRGTYLGYSNVTHAIKGHCVWLLALDRIVVVKNLRR